jgi:hypothetical protein
MTNQSGVVIAPVGGAGSAAVGDALVAGCEEPPWGVLEDSPPLHATTAAAVRTGMKCLSFILLASYLGRRSQGRSPPGTGYEPLT